MSFDAVKSWWRAIVEFLLFFATVRGNDTVCESKATLC